MSRLPVNNFPSSRGTSRWSTTCCFLHDKRPPARVRTYLAERLFTAGKTSRGPATCVARYRSRRDETGRRALVFFCEAAGVKIAAISRGPGARLPVAHSYARLIAAPHCAAQRRVPRTHGLVRAPPHACVHLAYGTPRPRYARFFRIVRIRCAPPRRLSGRLLARGEPSATPTLPSLLNRAKNCWNNRPIMSHFSEKFYFNDL